MLMGAHIGLTLSSYVVAVLLARGLGPATYGVYGIVYSVLLGVELIGRLGIPQAASKLVAEQESEGQGLEATGITLTAVLYLAIFSGFWLLSSRLASIFQVEDGASLFRIAAFDIPFYGLYFICSHILNGRRSFGWESLGLLVYSLTRVLGISLLFLTGISVAGALWVNVAASLLGLGFVAAAVGRASFRPTLEYARPLLLLAIPIGLFALGSQCLISMDLWALNALGSDVAAEVKGLYVAATNLSRIPNITAFVASAVLIPSVSRAYAQNDVAAAETTVKKGVSLLMMLILPICGLMAVRAASTMELVFSESYRSGASLLAMLVVAHGLFFTLQMVFSGILIASGKARAAATLSLAILPVSMLLNVWLVSTAGARGATLAALIATALGAVAGGYLVNHAVTSIVLPGAYLKMLVVTGIVCLVAWGLPFEGIGFIAAMLILGLVYLGLLFLVGLIRRADLALLAPNR